MDEIGTGKMGDTRFKTSNHCSQTISKHRVIEACDSTNGRDAIFSCRDAINRVSTKGKVPLTAVSTFRRTSPTPPSTNAPS
jgi:hypothetical protein